MPVQSSSSDDAPVCSIGVGLAHELGIQQNLSGGWEHRSPQEERDNRECKYFDPDEDDKLCADFMKSVQTSPHDEFNKLAQDELLEQKKALGFDGPEGEAQFQRMKQQYLHHAVESFRQKKNSEPSWMREAKQWVEENSVDEQSFHENVNKITMEMTNRDRARRLELLRQRKKKACDMPGVTASMACLSKWQKRAKEATQEYMTNITDIGADKEAEMDERLGDGSGDRWFEQALKCFERMPIKPTPVQVEFLKRHFLYVNLPHIYQHEFLRNKVKLLRRLRKDRFQKAAFLTCPRQFGKSTTTAMGAAALLYVGRGINIVMVANSQGSASDLMKKTMVNFVAVAGTDRVIFNNQKMCCVTKAGIPPSTPHDTIIRNGWFNTVRACSGNARTQRGINASVIILDEAAFINKAMLEEVIGPLIKVRNTTIIALSTHSGGENWFSRLFKRRDKQIERMLTRMEVTFMCSECESRGFKTCEHNRNLQPKWHDRDAEELIQLFIPNEELFAQEVLGKIINSADKRIFAYGFLDTLFGRPPAPIEELKNDPKLMLTFIDPKGNSEHTSYFAVCTVLLTSNNSVLLVGFDETEATLTVPKKEFLRNYFAALSHHPLYDHKTTMIVTTESNYSAMESHEWATLACEVIGDRFAYDSVWEYRDEETKSGARTYEKTKSTAASELIVDFMHSAVYVCPEFVCTMPSRRQAIQNSFVRQMTNMKVDSHGSISGKAKNEHDDMAIVFMLAVNKIKEIKKDLSNEISIQQTMASFKEDSRNTRANGHFVSPTIVTR